MFGFIKEIFVGFLGFGGSLVSDRTKCLSLNNRPCQARPTLVEKTLMNFSIVHILSVLIGVVEVVMAHMLEYIIRIK